MMSVCTSAVATACRNASTANAKYTHHKAHATVNASATAVSRAASSGRCEALAPTATIDSPSAMITNSPNRSGMWSASNRIRASRLRSNAGTDRSTSPASAQSTTRQPPGANPPASSSGPVTNSATLNGLSTMRPPRK